MAYLVPDDLWAALAPLLPPEPAKPKGGRPRVPDRVALAGILLVLRTGMQWRELPAELGCSGKTCWRRLRAWHTGGVWAALHRALLERLHGAGQLDWSRCALDSAAVAAKRMARPVGKWFVSDGLSSLRKRIRPPGQSPGPRWRSARAGPPKGDGV